MLRNFKVLMVVAALFVSEAALAQRVDQGAPGKQGPWPVEVTNTVAPTPSSVKTGVNPDPGEPLNVAVSVTSACVGPADSACATDGLVANSCVRIVCSVNVYYSVGTSTATAATTSVFLPARSVESFCLTGGKDAIAFIVSTGSGTCGVSMRSTVAIE